MFVEVVVLKCGDMGGVIFYLYGGVFCFGGLYMYCGVMMCFVNDVGLLVWVFDYWFVFEYLSLVVFDDVLVVYDVMCM